MKSLTVILVLGMAFYAHAVEPDIEYIYPAGGQRGSTLKVRVGGYYFHGQANFEMLGAGVKVSPLVKRTQTTWFEGPLIYQPLSQQKEDYPKDHVGEVAIAKDAAIGTRLWRCWTSQGATRPLRFVVGELPEVMENEMDGRPIPQPVTLPITANGRIFPREDIDIWTFSAKTDLAPADLGAGHNSFPSGHTTIAMTLQPPPSRPETESCEDRAGRGTVPDAVKPA